jgi:hypothetical protein
MEHICFKTLRDNGYDLGKVIDTPLILNEITHEWEAIGLHLRVPRKYPNGVKKLSFVNIKLNYCPLCGKRLGQDGTANGE